MACRWRVAHVSLTGNANPPLSRQRECGGSVRLVYSDGTHSCGLRPLGALPDLEFNPLVFLERAEPAALNLRVVDKEIGGDVLSRDKAEALLRVEPLHSSLWHFSLTSFSVTARATPCFGPP